MKRALFALLFTCSSAFASEQICYRNMGLYIADVDFSVYDQRGTLRSEHHRNVLLNQERCVNFEFEKEAVHVRVQHQVFIEIRTETCSFHLPAPARVVSEGTTLQYKCVVLPLN